jgi:hypothetical protein
MMLYGVAIEYYPLDTEKCCNEQLKVPCFEQDEEWR